MRDTVTGAVADWAVYDRAALGPGASLRGPAIIAEDETSTLVGPRWSACDQCARLYRTRAGSGRDGGRKRRAGARIQRQIMWNRLIAVVEEQAQTMIRTAFSTTVREAGDLSAGIFDIARPDAGAGGHRARPAM